MRISGGIAAAACAAGLLSSGEAAANGRYPASTQIVFSRDAAYPDLVVVRTTYGLLISRDAGATWRWLCESALGVPTVSVEDPSIALTAHDALVVGLVEGLDVSHDQGCNFGCVDGPLAGQSIVDLAVRSDAPGTVLALSSSFLFADAGSPDAAKSFSLDNRIWQSQDDGVHWTELGAVDPTVSVTTLDVAGSDPQRLYVSGTRGFGSSRSASLFVSTDDGASWVERPMPFDPTTEVEVFIGAVDPSAADRVYLQSSGVSRLYVTNDAGRSFQVPLTLTGQMLGFAIAPDGTTVYAGSEEDGLFAAAATLDPDAGLAFQKVSSIHVQCLAAHGTELWACSDEESGFVVGASSPGAGSASTKGATSFVPKLHNGGLAGPVACAPSEPSTQGSFACQADANASQCAGASFAALCTALSGCTADDGGATDRADAGTLNLAGPGAPSLVLPVRSPSCGCSTLGARGDATALAVASALSAIALRRRRRRSD